MAPSTALPDGLVAFVKRDCATCQTVAPVLLALQSGAALTVYTQDDVTFPEGLDPQDDTSLRLSWHHDVEVVPLRRSVDLLEDPARHEDATFRVDLVLVFAVEHASGVVAGDSGRAMGICSTSPHR